MAAVRHFSRGISNTVRRVLSHPLARHLDLDAPATAAVHRRIIEEKPLLLDVYDEWYSALTEAIGDAHPVLEIGSGAGHLATRVPGLLTSDVQGMPGIRVVLDAHQLPFGTQSLGAIAMTNVLHHLSDVRAFFHEAARTVTPGGVCVAIEPWVTPWSAFVYRHLHHEPFDPEASDWSLPTQGRLSGANDALPWIIFDRDRDRFERECPDWTVETVRLGWPMRYLLSGGVSLRALLPDAARGLLRRMDRRLERRAERWAMFALVVLRRRGAGHRKRADGDTD